MRLSSTASMKPAKIKVYPAYTWTAGRVGNGWREEGSG